MVAVNRYALVGTGVHSHRFELEEGVTRCGRAQLERGIVLDDPSVSRLHAEIHVAGDTIDVQDLDSCNGTFVNGERVAHWRVCAGDRITFGSIELQLTRVKGAGNESSRSPVRPHERGHEPERQPRFSRPSELGWAEVTWSSAEPRGDGDALGSTLGSTLGSNRRSSFGAALLDLGHFLVSDQGEDRVHENCLRVVAQLFDYRLACLLVMNPAGEIEVRCTLSPDGEAGRLHVSRSLVDTALRQRRALLLQDTKALNLGDSTRREGICSALVVPLFENDEVLGVIYLDQCDANRAFTERHLQRLEILANLVAAKVLQSRAHNEMNTAGYIQRSMLDSKAQAPAGYEVAFRLQPSIQVGGDFYEMLRLTDGRYLIALGDVAGHGVGAALLMANMLATLRALAPLATSPLGLIRQLSDLLTETLRPHGFVTLFLGFLDPERHALEYVSAGHEFPALFVPGRPATWVDSTGMPLGIPEPPVELQAATLMLPPGALLCAWSDGIPDALCRTVQPPAEFSRERLLRRLNRLRHETPAEIVRRVFAHVDSFMQSPHAHDDRTLLVLRRNEV